MAYCRFGEDSDISLYPNVAGGWELLTARGTRLTLRYPVEVLQALILFKAEGLQVPQRVFERLGREMES